MKFSLSNSIEILSRTPSVLENLLGNLNEEWTSNNEGPETWSPFDVVGHMIHAEKTDWIDRLEIIIGESDNKTFPPFDRFAQFNESKDKSLGQLLGEFKKLRVQNIQVLVSKNISDKMLEMKGIHPSLGEVTMKNLLSTWTVHDLSHIAQIVRVMGKQYKDEVGPWVEYLPFLSK